MGTEELTGRLKAVREALALTQREMATRLGITQVAWHQYETGKNIPGGLTLKALCEQKININWLLCGVGEMFDMSTPSASDAESPIVNQQLQRLHELETFVQKLGLTELAAVAESGHLEVECEVLELLCKRHPRGSTMHELRSAIASHGPEKDLRRLETAVQFLTLRGLVRAPATPHEEYILVLDAMPFVARDVSYHIQLLRSAIKFYSKTVFPAMQMYPQQGRIQRTTFQVSEARHQSMLDALTDAATRSAGQLHEPDGTHEVEFVIGVALNAP